ncbi:MAG: FtsW/RodA/SpoVE family cell cycle protein, partial [Coriobacteriales bacterium]|nr:FtsW/RodA/SpoVE family cell cycle protein [Coriobacteriales bacterium]
VLENIGMDFGLMPITGFPLPFMSYGSSMMLTNFMAVGLILSVWRHRGVDSASTSSALDGPAA